MGKQTRMSPRQMSRHPIPQPFYHFMSLMTTEHGRSGLDDVKNEYFYPPPACLHTRSTHPARGVSKNYTVTVKPFYHISIITENGQSGLIETTTVSSSTPSARLHTRSLINPARGVPNKLFPVSVSYRRRRRLNGRGYARGSRTSSHRGAQQ